jgi:glycosyltransferase 2 family protein
MLVTMLPISVAGGGVREATMMVAFGYAGLIGSDGTAVSIPFSPIVFIVGALAG